MFDFISAGLFIEGGNFGGLLRKRKKLVFGFEAKKMIFLLT